MSTEMTQFNHELTNCCLLNIQKQILHSSLRIKYNNIQIGVKLQPKAIPSLDVWKYLTKKLNICMIFVCKIQAEYN